MSLQANVTNLMIISPQDIYGNIITELDNLVFTAVLNDGTNIITSKNKPQS